MPRPYCPRRVWGHPVASVFKPAGRPLTTLEEIVLSLDEFEAIRLADLDALYQEQAAERMAVSRPTFARIVDAARRKVADALVHGKALRIQGGPVHPTAGRRQCCRLHDAQAHDGQPSGDQPLVAPLRRGRGHRLVTSPPENSSS